MSMYSSFLLWMTLVLSLTINNGLVQQVSATGSATSVDQSNTRFGSISRNTYTNKGYYNSYQHNINTNTNNIVNVDIDVTGNNDVKTTNAIPITGDDHSKQHNNNDNNITDPIEDYSTSFISAHIPFSIHSRDGYDHVKADFGFTHAKQGSIQSYLYYIDNINLLCNPISSISDDAVKQSLYPMQAIELPYILLIKHGGYCSAVTIARNAQAIGASALLIGNDKCLCSDTNCTNNYGHEDCTDNPVFLPKDGSASVNDIHLPTFLLQRVSTEILINTIKTPQPILMEVTWGIPPPASVHAYVTKPVQHRMWMSAYDPLIDVPTLQELKLVTDSFSNDQAIFTPHYTIIDGERFGCKNSAPGTNTTPEGPCDNLCTNHGRYCTVHAKDLSGHAILQETVRRLCIAKLYWNNHTGSDLYWTYVIQHRIHCSTPWQFSNDTCIEEVYVAANIPVGSESHALYHDINDCMKTEGNLDTDAINTLLQHQLDTQRDFGIVQTPAITIERQHLVRDSTGSALNPANLFYGICDYYWSLTSPFVNTTAIINYPTICDTCGPCPNVLGCLRNNGHCVEFSTHTPASGHSSSHESNEHKHGDAKKHRRRSWFWTFFWILLIGGGGYYCYKQQMCGSLLELIGRFRSSSSSNDRSGLLNNYFQLGTEE